MCWYLPPPSGGLLDSCNRDTAEVIDLTLEKTSGRRESEEGDDWLDSRLRGVGEDVMAVEGRKSWNERRFEPVVVDFERV